MKNTAKQVLESELKIDKLTPIQFDGIIRAMKKYTKEKLLEFADHADNLYRPHTRDNILAWENVEDWVKENLQK